MDKVRMMTWNIRGINNNVARRNLQDLVRSCKVDVICVQETKCEDCKIFRSSCILSQVDYGMVSQPSVGLSGGIATFWYLANVKCVALAQAKHWVWNTFSLTTGLGGRFHVVNVYSPHSIAAKRVLWNELK